MLWRSIHHFCRSILIYQHPPSGVTNSTKTTHKIWQSLCNHQHRTLNTCVTSQIWSCNKHKIVTNRMCHHNCFGQLQPCRNVSVTSSTCLPKSSDYAPDESAGGEDQTGPDASKMSFWEARTQGFLKSRRRMSPFHRVAGLMEEQKLPTKNFGDEFGEVTDTSEKLSTETEDNLSSLDAGDKDRDLMTKAADDVEIADNHELAGSQQKQKTSIPLSHGELIMAIGDLSKKGNMRKLSKLNRVTTFECNLGTVRHSEIIGSHSGQVHTTHLGFPVVFRRPSLEEYVLQMKRGPAILYPKDASVILTMADISSGDVVLEAGTGSGAMTLFISKAVGSTGHVITFDKRKDHQERAIINTNKWKRSWDIGHPDEKWPDNVSFHNTGLQHCDEIVGDDTIDGVILDVGAASHLMPILCRKLKAGKAIIVYVPQMTQTMDILDTIRAHQLPIMLEIVQEVTHRSWLVKEAKITNAEMDEDNSSNAVKYMCRPHHNQFPHTGFLLHLRKIVLSSTSEN